VPWAVDSGTPISLEWGGCLFADVWRKGRTAPVWLVNPGADTVWKNLGGSSRKGAVALMMLDEHGFNDSVRNPAAGGASAPSTGKTIRFTPCAVTRSNGEA
jgi:hypothetical protein